MDWKFATPATPTVGHGNVNRWADDGMIDYLQDAVCLRKSGQTVRILEGLSWPGGRNGAGFANDDACEACCKAYGKLLKINRGAKIVTWPFCINFNSSLSKLGNKAVPLSASRPRIERFCNAVLKGGPRGVWVTVVNECKTPEWDALEAAWARRFREAGFPVIFQGSGGQPSGCPAGYAGFAYHPASTATKAPKGAMIVTDHSGILNQLGEGGLWGKRWKREATRDYVAGQRAAGRGVYLYGFAHETLDRDMIAAL